MEPLTLSEPQPSPQNSLPTPQKTYHVLVGVTGSVAALKLPILVSELLEIPGLKVRVVTTERAKHFYNPQEIPVTLYSDTEEWQLWKGRTDPVLHIDLRRWADLMLVAPLDANTLAKIANGICDNLLEFVLEDISLLRIDLGSKGGSSTTMQLLPWSICSLPVCSDGSPAPHGTVVQTC
ncbi:phosphopantothenoylcysteine decarboxylase isoform X3 [Chelonoidis abingdonii]|uniref:phosphopantothenoylcysteine decarboxylase isoform X3 n=1 Tax=Chelonoidis abingdonii TaxID=106734 RepID=UPI003F493F14